MALYYQRSHTLTWRREDIADDERPFEDRPRNVPLILSLLAVRPEEVGAQEIERQALSQFGRAARGFSSAVDLEKFCAEIGVRSYSRSQATSSGELAMQAMAAFRDPQFGNDVCPSWGCLYWAHMVPEVRTTLYPLLQVLQDHGLGDVVPCGVSQCGSNAFAAALALALVQHPHARHGSDGCGVLTSDLVVFPVARRQDGLTYLSDSASVSAFSCGKQRWRLDAAKVFRNLISRTLDTEGLEACIASVNTSGDLRTPVVLSGLGATPRSRLGDALRQRGWTVFHSDDDLGNANMPRAMADWLGGEEPSSTGEILFVNCCSGGSVGVVKMSERTGQ